MTSELIRQTFSVSRELEFFSEGELTTQTGYSREHWWPNVTAKELIDNSLDACESAGVPPRIEVDFQGGFLSVIDNGCGLPAEVITRILDFTSRTSDKVNYVAPTRGAQGNALKTVLAIPYVLGEGNPAKIQIESMGVRHILRISTNQIHQRPQIDHRKEKIVRNSGTSLRVFSNLASTKAAESKPEFLQKLVQDFALFNPHARLELTDHGKNLVIDPTAPGWRKWLPSDPTSAWWYDEERLQTLIGSFIAAECDGGRVRTVREFVSEFRGLSATAKQKQVTGRTGLDRAYLHDLASNGRFDQKAVAGLLAAMQEISTPVKPETLGLLGREHFEQRLQPEGDTFRYALKKGTDVSGLPFLIEVAFAATAEDGGVRGIHTGLNWSSQFENPFSDDLFHDDNNQAVWGMTALLANRRINLESDPISLVVHVAYPRFRFLDRGKSSVSLADANDESILHGLTEAVLSVTKPWSTIKKREDRAERRNDRLREKYWRGHDPRISIKQAAWEVMATCYQQVSADGKGGNLSANARQIFYVGRELIQKKTGETVTDSYFIQNLLTSYMRNFPDETADWRVEFDRRGTFLEPHTEREIGLGTREVREYFEDIESERDNLLIPRLLTQFPTCGWTNRYNAVLFIEKEGFQELLQDAKFAERFDMAIMSTKGMASTAARRLIDDLPPTVTVYAVHDFDVAGFAIAGILKRDTVRFQFKGVPTVVDLGLRLRDVEKWGLRSEADPRNKGNDRWNLEKDGATKAEIEFLCEKKHRVELNAFTSSQLVEWLNSKLIEHRARKVIPDKATLETAWRRRAKIARLQKIIDAAGPEIETYAKGLVVPRDLERQVKTALRRTPALAWDEALHLLARRQKGRKTRT